ncbi:MAG: RNA 2',3'-cyclic phosphodiesterase [Myxococcaceae bacterium]
MAVGGPSLLRLFVAGPLPDALQAQLFATLAATRRAASQARWVRPGQLHLTLDFLGEVDDSALPSLVDALRPVGSRHPALQLWLRGAGCFGRPHQPEVLFAELAGDVPGLGALEADVHEALQKWKRPPAEQASPAFHPHLTLARARGRRGDAALGRCQRALREQLLGGFLLERMVLFRSQLAQGGARHSPLVEFPLGSTAAAHA